MSLNIELNHLKYFYFTVLEGGVAQAAKRLHVQQPVVSKMLKLLEEQ
jgi:DNA-binding transcriptional LysR family regulator